MRLGVLLSFALKRLYRRKWIALLCVLMMTGALGILATVISLGSLSKNARKQISDMLPDPIRQYGELNLDCLSNEKLSDEDILKLYTDIAELPAVKSLGSIYESGIYGLQDEKGSTESWRRIREEQMKHPLVYTEKGAELPPQIDTAEIVQSVLIPISLWQAFDFPLYKGAVPSKTSENLIYVGYNFRNSVTVGTMLTDGQNQYRIAGVLQKGDTIPEKTSAFWNNSMRSLGGMSSVVLHVTNPMDNLVLVVFQGMTSDQLQILSWGEEYTREEVEAQIHSVTDQYGLPMYIASFEQKINDDLQFNDALAHILMPIAVIVGICSAILILCSQMLSVLQKKNDLGILLSQGVSRKGLYGILFSENLIQIILASVLTPLVIRAILLETNVGEAVRKAFWKSVAGSVGIVLFLLVLVLAVLSTATILFLLKATSSATLLKGELKSSSMVFRGLFIVSFTVSIGLVWYGQSLMERGKKVENVQQTTDYRFLQAWVENPAVSGYELLESAKKAGENGNIVVFCSLPVNRAAYGNEVRILFGASELEYPLSSGSYPASGRKTDAPACVIGEGMKESTYMENGIRYINLADCIYEVTGILCNNHFAGYDYRIWVFADTISGKIIGEYLQTSELCVSYCRNGDISQNDADCFYAWGEDLFGVMPHELTVLSEHEDDGSSSNVAALYTVTCRILMIISAITLIMLSLLWSIRHQLPHMIMRVNGYSRFRILLLDARMVLKYEFIALLLVLGTAYLTAIFSGSTDSFADTLRHRTWWLALLVLAFGFLSTIATSVRMLFEKPVSVLKHTE